MSLMKIFQIDLQDDGVLGLQQHKHLNLKNDHQQNKYHLGYEMQINGCEMLKMLDIKLEKNLKIDQLLHLADIDILICDMFEL